MAMFLSLFERMQSPTLRGESPATALPSASMSPATALGETPDMMRSESPLEAYSALAAFGGDSSAVEAESPVRTLCPQPRRLFLPLLEGGGGGLNSPILPPTSPDPVTPSNYELDHILKRELQGFEKADGYHLPFDGGRSIDSRPLSALSALSTQCLSTCATSSAGPTPSPDVGRQGASLLQLSMREAFHAASPSPGPWPMEDSWSTCSRRCWPELEAPMPCRVGEVPALQGCAPSDRAVAFGATAAGGSAGAQWSASRCSPTTGIVGEPWDMPMMVHPAAQYRSAASILDSGLPSLSAAAVGAAAAAAAAAAGTAGGWTQPATEQSARVSAQPPGILPAQWGPGLTPPQTAGWTQPATEQSARASAQPPGLLPPQWGPGFTPPHTAGAPGLAPPGPCAPGLAPPGPCAPGLAPPLAPCGWPPGLHCEAIDPGVAVSGTTSATATLAEAPKDEASLLDVIAEELPGQSKQRRSRRGGGRNKASELKPADMQQSKQSAPRLAISSHERCLELPDDHRLLQLSQTQAGSKFLQRKLLKGHPSVIKDILDGIEMELPALMCDAYGNYVCSAAFQACSGPQRHRMLEIAMIALREVAMDRWGTHSLQALISLLCTVEEQSLLMNSLRDHVVELSCDVHGVHVVQRALLSFGSSFLDVILHEVLRNFHVLAHNPHSLGLLKKCISQSRSGVSQQLLLETLSQQAVEFAQSTFGNYAVQHAFEEWGGEVCEPIVQALAGKLVQLSIQKFSSNVVEQMLISAMPSTRRVLLEELSNVEQMAILMSTVYGHYVARRALQIADSDQKVTLENAITLSFQSIRNRRLKARWERVLRGETDS